MRTLFLYRHRKKGKYRRKPDKNFLVSFAKNIWFNELKKRERPATASRNYSEYAVIKKKGDHQSSRSAIST